MVGGSCQTAPDSMFIPDSLGLGIWFPRVRSDEQSPLTGAAMAQSVSPEPLCVEGGVTGNVRDPEVRGGDVFLEEQQRQSGRVKWPPVPALTKDHKASGLTRHRAATLQSGGQHPEGSSWAGSQGGSRPASLLEAPGGVSWPFPASRRFHVPCFPSQQLGTSSLLGLCLPAPSFGAVVALPGPPGPFRWILLKVRGPAARVLAAISVPPPCHMTSSQAPGARMWASVGTVGLPDTPSSSPSHIAGCVPNLNLL